MNLPLGENYSLHDQSLNGMISELYLMSRFFVAFGLLWSLAGPTTGAEFIPLGFLPDGSFTRVTGISDDAHIVVGTSNDEAFRWSEETGMVGLGFLPGFESFSSAGGGRFRPTDGISGDGTTIVGHSRSDTNPNPDYRYAAFVDTAANGMVELSGAKIAYDASFDGGVIVGQSDDDKAFRWTQEEGLQQLDALHVSDASVAWSITPDATTIAGTSYDPDSFPDQELVVWKDGAVTGTGIHPSSTNVSLSDDGSTLVGLHLPPEGEIRAFKWTQADGATDLGWLPNSTNEHGYRWSQATSTNNNGSVIIGRSGAGTKLGDINLGQPFVWTVATGMVNLQDLLTDRFQLSLGDWHLLAPTDITPDGKSIVGTGINPDGNYEGWLVRLESALMPPSDVRGDFDLNGELTVNDIDLLSEAIREDSTDSFFDLNESGSTDIDDLAVFIHEEFNTYFGDANLDGEFNSSDLVDVFEAGQYELGAVSSWSTGDWNTDGHFGSGDLVAAFQDGGYENGPRDAVRAVPEPASAAFAFIALIIILMTNQRRRH